MRAVARVNEVRVTVDQSGRDPAAGAIDHVRSIERRRIRTAARKDDPPILTGDDTVFQHAHTGHGGESSVLPQTVTFKGRLAIH